MPVIIPKGDATWEFVSSAAHKEKSVRWNEDQRDVSLKSTINFPRNSNIIRVKDNTAHAFANGTFTATMSFDPTKKIDATCSRPQPLIPTKPIFFNATPDQIWDGSTAAEGEQNVVIGTECQQLNLTDGWGFQPPYDFTTEKATYDRVFSAIDNGDGTWTSKAYSVCLPYPVYLDMEEVLDKGLAIYELWNINEETGQFIFSNATPNHLLAGHSYVLVVKNGSVQLNSDKDKLPDWAPASLEVKANPYDKEYVFFLADNANEEVDPAGLWTGTFMPMSNADCKAKKTYIIQKDGYFRRITNNTVDITMYGIWYNNVYYSQEGRSVKFKVTPNDVAYNVTSVSLKRNSETSIRPCIPDEDGVYAFSLDGTLFGNITILTETGMSDWPGGGSGTEGEPYKISTAAHWEYFVRVVKAGYSFSGKYVKLEDNITFNEWRWPAYDESGPQSKLVGTPDYPFKGTFLGNNKKLTFNISGQVCYIAPFRYIDGATIQDLIIDGTIMNSQAKDYYGRYTAGLVANASGNCEISNCVVMGTVQGVLNSAVSSNGGFIANISSGHTNMYGCAFIGNFFPMEPRAALWAMCIQGQDYLFRYVSLRR